MPTAEIVTLTFRNDSGVTVCVVFASPVASETYGDNILGNDLAEPGDSRTFELPVDTHALSVYDCDSNEPITEVGFDVYQPTEWRVDDTVLDDRSEPAASRWA
jgi:hypothetical protein